METIDLIYDKIEKALDGLDLMQGDGVVLKRMVFGAALGAGIVWIWKPESMFDRKTKAPRAWSFFVKDGEKPSVDPTSFPWYFSGILGAFVLGVLV